MLRYGADPGFPLLSAVRRLVPSVGNTGGNHGLKFGADRRGNRKNAVSGQCGMGRNQRQKSGKKYGGEGVHGFSEEPDTTGGLKEEMKLETVLKKKYIHSKYL